MKVFISADIEGITTTTTWDHCNPAHASYAQHAAQMTREVVAACEGAIEAGATQIVIKDAHGSATNIDPQKLPACATILRGWSGHPYMMAEGIDQSFDAALFVGFHSAAGREGSPLSHTISGKCAYIKINGRVASEFMLYSGACAFEGVPSVFLSGDRMLCEDYADLHPNLITVPVKEGIGSMTLNKSPEATVPCIREAAARALRQDLSNALPRMESHFDVELFYRQHFDAQRVSYFPGVRKQSDNIVSFRTDSYYELLRTILWIV